VVELKHFKFGVQFDHSKFQLTVIKLSLKGAWSHNETHYIFLLPPKYLWNGLETSDLVCNVDHSMSQPMDDQLFQKRHGHIT